MTQPNAPLQLIEIPGMRGTLKIHYDLSKFPPPVSLDCQGVDLRQVVQILLSVIQGAVVEWIRIDQGIIRPKPGGESGNQEGAKNDDHDH